MLLLALALQAPPPPGWPSFVTAFRQFVATDSIVGGSAVLVRNGQVVARMESGMADRSRRQPADTATLYHWASNTKPLTAVAIMQLRDRGLLSLDDPVTKWVPELQQVHDPFGSMDQVTVRMVLSHSAGFQSPTWPYGRGAPWEPFEPTRWEQLVAMMPYQQLLFAPGSRYHYSNPGFVYLARIIEEVTGDPWVAYIQKNIWTPLGMNRSYVNTTPWHLAGQRANNYTLLRDGSGRVTMRENGREFNPGITIPNGGWNAPVGDVVAWASFLTGDGKAQVLSRTSLAEMWQPVVPVDEDGTSMGLSFFLRHELDQDLAFHTGEQAGFRSIVMVNPARHTAVIVVVNTTNDADAVGSGRRWDALLRATASLAATH